MTAQQDSGRGSLPICDHQLLGRTPQAYSAQSPESAEEAVRGHLITNTIIPPVDRSATSFELTEGLGQGEGRAGGLGRREQREVRDKGCKTALPLET